MSISIMDKIKLPDGTVIDIVPYIPNATQISDGLMSGNDKTKLDGIAEGATANVGTVTGISMNGVVKGTSGIVNLGTIITGHQDISGKANVSQTVSTVTYNGESRKITKTINGTETDVVSLETLKEDMGLDSVENKSSSEILSELTYSNVTDALNYIPASLDSNGRIPVGEMPTSVILPQVTSSDNGKVLRVVNGHWSAAALLAASGVSY